MSIRLRHMLRLSPSASEINSVGPEDLVTFAPMDAIRDGLGGLNVEITKPLDEVRSGSYNYFRDGDALLAKVTPCFENGKKALAVSHENGIGFATSEVHVLRVDPTKIDLRFLMYLLSSEDFRADGMKSMTGAGGLKRVSEGAILNFRPNISDLPLQKRIAAFLDRETARIDDLIEKKKRLVEVLLQHEKNQLKSMFAGLDAPEWRVRHLGKVKNGSGFPIDHQGVSSNEIPFFKVRHLRTHGLDASIMVSEDTISAETANLLRATIFPKGTIIFAKIGAALLLARFSKIGVDACLDNNLAAFIPRTQLISPDFAHLGLSLIDMVTMVQPGAVPSMDTEAFYNFRMSLPELKVQNVFVSEYRAFRDRIIVTSKKVESSIDRLREYRAALITAAVTGQIDVDAYGKAGATSAALHQIEEGTEA